MNEIINKIINIDYERVKNDIVSFLRYEAESNNKIFILGLSGGIDSSVVLKLASFTKIGIVSLIMPYTKVTPKEDVEDAIELATDCSVEYHIIELDNIYEKILDTLPTNKYAAGNLLARLRMALLYYYANLKNGMVLGTSDRSEILIGYFTKYGDGASDLLPIASLYKLQVRRLAEYLNIKDEIIKKKSSPRLWEDHMAETELGLGYEEIDSILYCIFDLKMDISRVKSIFDATKVDKVIELHRRANHKRIMPKICIIK
ncbi:MAG: NAD+ synthase [Candidatus Nitrosocaldaceae archaeon]